jgi:hypothetical protein
MPQSSKWSVITLPAPPGLAEGRQGCRVRTLDWSRCGRYLRACGEEKASIGRSSLGNFKESLKEKNSWIRVWSVQNVPLHYRAGEPATWEQGVELALSEGGGGQMFLHPLHVALVRTVKW